MLVVGVFCDPSLGPASEQLIRLQDFLGERIVGTLLLFEKYKLSIAVIKPTYTASLDGSPSFLARIKNIDWTGISAAPRL